MKFSIEKNISPFIENQFPQFYQEEGPTFIQFVKAYYEWMEDTGNPIGEARNLLNYRDIDNTIESFLEHFQKKYLYGIPFNVIVNKRYLLKHILDVYRSKSSIQCYKLLFRLIYNQDVDIYLPANDIIRASDGTWVEPKYLELNTGNNFDDIISTYVGKTIIGTSSGTTAIVESFIKEPINNNIISTITISNILPKGGNFIQGEKVVLLENKNDSNFITNAPTIIGSLNDINIINGGQNFKVGDIIKIAHRDISNNSVISYGIDGLLKVTSLKKTFGQINFNIDNGGFGFTSNSLIFIYNNPLDTTGNGASFNISSLSYTKNITYNTDLIVDYNNLYINATAYGFPANTSSNNSSTLNSCFSYTNNIFGSINSLTNIKTGNGYTLPLSIFVRSTLLSNSLSGNISYTTSNNNIVGTNTLFTQYFSNNDIIAIRSNSSLSSTEEYHTIRTVVNNSMITLYDKPKYNSTLSAQYKIAPAILPSNFAVYDSIMYQPDGSIPGLNDSISGIPSSGNNIISTVSVINSGKGYVDGENVIMYLYGGLSVPTVINGGINYANGESLIFSGGGSTSPAVGYVTTDSNGTITSTSLSYQGSGYSTIPKISVFTKNGTGAYFNTSIVEFNTFSEVTGKVIKGGIGKKIGNWTTTRGFLNSDKYIQDSYFYQDYSYQIKAADTLDKYKNILYNTFHISGTELFGTYYQSIIESSNTDILYEQTSANLS